MKPERVWSDLYGCPRGLWVGRAGGHEWLVACPPALAAQALGALDSLSFKGAVHVIVTENVVPLQAAVRAVRPRGVLVVGETLGGGSAVSVPAREVDVGGVSYREGGDYPAWSSAVRPDGRRGECAQASGCAALGVGVATAAPGDVTGVLHDWFASVPHSLLVE